MDERQNKRLFGKASISVNIVEPVVVYPETLSYHALMMVNSPPYMIYGKAPTRNDNSHAETMITYPSFSLTLGTSCPKMNGKEPTRSVIRALISIGENPESYPFATDMSTERIMKKALTSNTLPIFLDITLKFMIILRSDILESRLRTRLQKRAQTMKDTDHILQVYLLFSTPLQEAMQIQVS